MGVRSFFIYNETRASAPLKRTIGRRHVTVRSSATANICDNAALFTCASFPTIQCTRYRRVAQRQRAWSVQTVRRNQQNKARTRSQSRPPSVLGLTARALLVLHSNPRPFSQWSQSHQCRAAPSHRARCVPTAPAPTHHRGQPVGAPKQMWPFWKCAHLNVAHVLQALQEKHASAHGDHGHLGGLPQGVASANAQKPGKARLRNDRAHAREESRDCRRGSGLGGAALCHCRRVCARASLCTPRRAAPRRARAEHTSLRGVCIGERDR